MPPPLQLNDSEYLMSVSSSSEQSENAFNVAVPPPLQLNDSEYLKSVSSSSEQSEKAFNVAVPHEASTYFQ